MNFRIFALLMWVALLAGCRTHPPRVDCDGHLQPINAPAAVTKTPDPHP
jgi:hypothetical protein